MVQEIKMRMIDKSDPRFAFDTFFFPVGEGCTHESNTRGITFMSFIFAFDKTQSGSQLDAKPHSKAVDTAQYLAKPCSQFPESLQGSRQC